MPVDVTPAERVRFARELTAAIIGQDLPDAPPPSIDCADDPDNYYED